jgi:hypothetical protein
VKLGRHIFRWIHNCSVVHRARNFLHWFVVVSTGHFQIALLCCSLHWTFPNCITVFQSPLDISKLHYSVPYIALNTHFAINFWMLLLWSVLTGTALTGVLRCRLAGLALYTVHKVCHAITCCVILVISSSAYSLSRLVECQLFVLRTWRDSVTFCTCSWSLFAVQSVAECMNMALLLHRYQHCVRESAMWPLDMCTVLEEWCLNGRRQMCTGFCIITEAFVIWCIDNLKLV